MEKEIYTPMERILIEGAQKATERQEHKNKLLLLLDYEMEQLIRGLEKQLEEQGAEEVIL